MKVAGHTEAVVLPRLQICISEELARVQYHVKGYLTLSGLCSQVTEYTLPACKDVRSHT